MRIRFCGAAGTTTGSQHLIEVNGSRILLDCGLYQGRREESYRRNKEFLFDPASLDAVALSHAHIDHSGNLPNLTKQGFRGNIYCTFATRDLCQIMLQDSARIQMGDVQYVNKKRLRNGQAPFKPLYDEFEAEAAMRQFVTIGYQRPLPIAPGVTLSFEDAGHILGSAQVVLDIIEQPGGGRRRLLFSGDVGRGRNVLLRNPAPVQDVDDLIVESTYGGIRHELPTQAHEHLARVLNQALERKGKIIIPAFAVERTQQLLYALHELFQSREIPRVPVYVDSPLAVSATEIFRLHPESFNEEVYPSLFEKENPFGFENLTLIRSVRQSRELNDQHCTCIIISASGMCEAGRVLHHLKNSIENPSTTILFVGYCAEDTLGWKIRAGWNEVRIFGEPFRVRATVETLDSFSGHADHEEMLAYFRAMSGPRRRVFLVHGEPERSAALAEALAELHPEGEISRPSRGDMVEL